MRDEHSIEVQMPFIEYRCPRARIAPVMMGLQDLGSAAVLGERIVRAIQETGREVRVVASSDFSHYVPDRVARSQDLYAIEALSDLDLERFYGRIAERHVTACGYGPIAAACTGRDQRGEARTPAPVRDERRCDRRYVLCRGVCGTSGGIRVATWSAPGKVFLFGEHAVVYDKPGLAMAIKPRILVSVRRHRHPAPAKSPSSTGASGSST